ncbi:hypothetical protein D3C87_1793030 [compost metagenome]
MLAIALGQRGAWVGALQGFAQGVGQIGIWQLGDSARCSAACLTRAIDMAAVLGENKTIHRAHPEFVDM